VGWGWGLGLCERCGHPEGRQLWCNTNLGCAGQNVQQLYIMLRLVPRMAVVLVQQGRQTLSDTLDCLHQRVTVSVSMVCLHQHSCHEALLPGACPGPGGTCQHLQMVVLSRPCQHSIMHANCRCLSAAALCVGCCLQDKVGSRTVEGRKLRRGVLKGSVIAFVTAGGRHRAAGGTPPPAPLGR
jgi:hypothetical protein